ncbi:MAG: hypothetical protein U9P71_03360, partial [Campylobacterota bacterium]|nr:hypothetical protein [Campylobacterota bacterium]
MLKLIVSLVFMYVTALSAISNEALQSAKTVTNSKPSYASLLSPQIRSDESELLKLLGKWEVSTGQIDAEMINYFNISYVGMGDNYFEAFGTDSLIDYSSGDALECLYDLGSTYSQKYVCISMIYEGMYNWYFFNLVDSNTIDGVYVFSSVDNIEENYAWTTSLLHGKKEGTGTATPSEDIISSNLSALKSDLLNTKTYSVSGSFAAYDFAGVDAAFDWAFVTPKNDVYQLQGNAPSANDAFGWKQVYVNPDEPAWYMAYLDDWDGDGNSKYDWILVGNGFDAVYKLEGVTATGNFSYSKKIDVQYSVSSDKKTISFGTSSSSDNDISNGDSYEKDIGSDGGEIKVPGAYVSIPSSAFSAKNAVSITTSLNNSFDTAQSIQEFYMKGIPENFSKPITLAAKQVDTQSNILLFKTENYIKSLDKTEETYTIVEGEVNDGYITYVIEPESLLKSAKRSGVGYFSVGWAALKGYKVFDTKKGHFRIYFPDAWLNEALDLEEHLEDAYSYYENMGFDLTRRTSWPMSVTIFQFTGGETGDSGYYNQSKRGAFSNNYGHITINRKYIGEPQTIKATTVHEL